MGTELQINIEKSNFEDIAKLTGQASFDGNRSTLSKLKINKESVDDDENAIPPGSFTFMHPEHGNVYGKTAKLRIFLRGYQYILYDAKNKENSVKSKIITSWSEEAIDTKGTVRCGKVPRKEADTLTSDQLEANNQIKCYQHIFGVLTMDAVNAKGEKVAIENHPVKMQVRGKNYMAMDEVIQVMSKKRREMVRTEINLSLKREKNGDVTYYVINTAVDFKSPHVWRGDDDMELLKDFIDYKDVVNEDVFKQYTKALKGGSVSKEDKALAKALTLDDFPDDDLEDIGRPVKGTVIDAG